MQDALVEALRVWPADPPRDPKGWLVTVAWRRFLDATRADAARRRREDLVDEEPAPGPAPAGGRHAPAVLPVRPPVADAVVRGRAHAARRRRADHPPDRPGLPGARGDHGAAHQPGQAHRLRRAVRPARRRRHRAARPLPGLQRGLLRRRRPRRRGHPAHPAARGRRSTTPRWRGCSPSCCCTTPGAPPGPRPTAAWCRSPSRTAAGGTPGSIAEGVEILQAALARDRLGEFQAQAAIAALHADAPTAEETDWVQIVEWYDELARLTDSPVVRLNRAVAVGEADGPRAGLAALAGAGRRRCPATPRWRRTCTSATATWRRRRGCTPRRPAKAANLAERDHLTRQAARLNSRPPR